PPAAEDRPLDDWAARSRPMRHPGQQPHRGTMILVFGILSLVMGCLGIVFGPIAWTMGNADLVEMRAGRMDPEGEGMTNAGRVCCMIGTILAGVAAALVLVYLLAWLVCMGSFLSGF